MSWYNKKTAKRVNSLLSIAYSVDEVTKSKILELSSRIDTMYERGIIGKELEDAEVELEHLLEVLESQIDESEEYDELELNEGNEHEDIEPGAQEQLAKAYYDIMINEHHHNYGETVFLADQVYDILDSEWFKQEWRGDRRSRQEFTVGQLVDIAKDSYETQVELRKRFGGSWHIKKTAQVEKTEQNPEVNFYYKIYKLIEQKVPNRTNPAQVLEIIKSPKAGVSQDELFWSGLEDWLGSMEPSAKITKEEVLDQVKGNSPQIGTSDIKDLDGVLPIFSWPYVNHGDLESGSIPKDKEIAQIIKTEGDYLVDIMQELHAIGAFETISQENFDDEEEQAEFLDRVDSAIAGNDEEFWNYLVESEWQHIWAYARYPHEYDESRVDYAHADINETGEGGEEPPIYNQIYNQLLLNRGLVLEEGTYGVRAKAVDILPSGEFVFDVYYPKDDRRANEVVSSGVAYSELDTTEFAYTVAKKVGHKDIPYSQEYEEWSSPGGENYRETLITWENMPGLGYESPHFNQQRDIIAHYRSKVRKDQDGNSVLFIEEIQSDWHQAGREEGYKSDSEYFDHKTLYETHPGLNEIREEYNRFRILANARWEDLKRKYALPDRFHVTQDLRLFTGTTLDNAGENKILSQRIFDDGNTYLTLSIRGRRFQGGIDEAANYFKTQRDPNKPDLSEAAFGLLASKTMEEAGWIAVSEKATPILSEVSKIDRDMRKRIPNAPYAGTGDWAGLALKKAVERAVMEGHDRVAWTPGWIQGDRYNFEDRFNRIVMGYLAKNDIGNNLTNEDLDNQELFPEVIIETWKDNQVQIQKRVPNTKSDIEELIGFELHQRVREQEIQYAAGSKTLVEKVLVGDDLKMENSGMNIFYDKMLPSIANKLFKKYKSKVEVSQVPIYSENYVKDIAKLHFLPLTLGSTGYLTDNIGSIYPQFYGKTILVSQDFRKLIDPIELRLGEMFKAKYIDWTTAKITLIAEILKPKYPDLIVYDIFPQIDTKVLERIWNNSNRMADGDENELVIIEEIRALRMVGGPFSSHKEAQEASLELARQRIYSQKMSESGPKMGMLDCLSIPITDKMRESVLSKGFSYYGGRDAMIKTSWYNKKSKVNKFATTNKYVDDRQALIEIIAPMFKKAWYSRRVKCAAALSFLKVADKESLRRTVDNVLAQSNDIPEPKRMNFLVKKLKRALAKEFGWVVDAFSSNPEDDIRYILDNYDRMPMDKDDPDFNPQKKRVILSPFVTDLQASDVPDDPFANEVRVWVETRLKNYRPMHVDWAVRQIMEVMGDNRDIKAMEHHLYPIINNLSTFIKNDHLFKGVELMKIDRYGLAQTVSSIKPDWESLAGDFDSGDIEIDKDTFPDLYERLTEKWLEETSEQDFYDIYEEIHGSTDEEDDYELQRREDRIEQWREDPSLISGYVGDGIDDEYERTVSELLDSGREPVNYGRLNSDGDVYDLYRCESLKDCKVLGYGTSWCFRAKSPEEYETAMGYLTDGDIWVIYKNNKPFRALDFFSQQYMDVDDNSMDMNEIQRMFAPWDKKMRSGSYQAGIEKGIMKKGRGEPIANGLIGPDHPDFSEEYKGLFLYENHALMKKSLKTGMFEPGSKEFVELLNHLCIKGGAHIRDDLIYQILKPNEEQQWAKEITDNMVGALSPRELFPLFMLDYIDAQKYPEKFKELTEGGARLSIKDHGHAIMDAIRKGKLTYNSSPNVIDGLIYSLHDAIQANKYGRNEYSTATIGAIAREIIQDETFPDDHPQIKNVAEMVLSYNAAMFYWVKKRRPELFTDEFVNSIATQEHFDYLDEIKEYASDEFSLNGRDVDWSYSTEMQHMLVWGLVDDTNNRDLLYKVINKAIERGHDKILLKILSVSPLGERTNSYDITLETAEYILNTIDRTELGEKLAREINTSNSPLRKSNTSAEIIQFVVNNFYLKYADSSVAATGFFFELDRENYEKVGFETIMHFWNAVAGTKREDEVIGSIENNYGPLPDVIVEDIRNRRGEKQARSLNRLIKLADLPSGLYYGDGEEYGYEAEELAKKYFNVLRGTEAKIVVLDNERVVAALFTDETNSEKFSFDVVVHPEYQKMGIGRELVEAAIEEFRYLQDVYGPDYYIDVHVINPNMRSLLESMGFDMHTQLNQDGDVMMKYQSIEPEMRERGEHGFLESEDYYSFHNAIKKDIDLDGKNVLKRKDTLPWENKEYRADEGQIRVSEDGQVEILTRVPLELIDFNKWNNIYTNRLEKYKSNYSHERPELYLKENGRYYIDNGHHRILADYENGEKDTLAWVWSGFSKKESMKNRKWFNKKSSVDKCESKFINEKGNKIRIKVMKQKSDDKDLDKEFVIQIIGPTSMSENIITEMEKEELTNCLNTVVSHNFSITKIAQRTEVPYEIQDKEGTGYWMRGVYKGHSFVTFTYDPVPDNNAIRKFNAKFQEVKNKVDAEKNRIADIPETEMPKDVQGELFSGEGTSEHDGDYTNWPAMRRRRVSWYSKKITKRGQTEKKTFSSEEILDILEEVGISATGNCGAKAIAINNTLMNGKGELVFALDKYSWEQGHKITLVEHVGVEYNGVIYDSEGIIDSPDQMSFGSDEIIIMTESDIRQEGLDPRQLMSESNCDNNIAGFFNEIENILLKKEKKVLRS